MNPEPTLPPSLSAVRTSRLAIASLVLGVLALPTLGLGGIAALGCGIAAMVSIRKHRPNLKGEGLAIAGIVIAGFTLLTVPILAGLLLPALAKAKQRAQAIHCVNNMKQICLGIRIYSSDHKEQFPDNLLMLQAEINDARVLRCPGAPSPDHGAGGTEWTSLRPLDVSYEYLGNGKSERDTPATEVVLRCPIHGSEGHADGSVFIGGGMGRRPNGARR